MLKNIQALFSVITFLFVFIFNFIFNLSLSFAYDNPENLIIKISPETINLVCKNYQLQPLFDPQNSNKVIGSLKCVDDSKVGQQVNVFIDPVSSTFTSILEKDSERVFVFEGEYLQSMLIIIDSPKDLVKFKNTHFPHSLKIKSKKLEFNETNIIPIDLDIDSDEVIISNDSRNDISNDKARLIGAYLKVISGNFKNQSSVEYKKINIQSNNISLSSSSVIDSEEGISLISQNNFSANGIIRSNGDISINAESAELKKGTKIFSNGIYRIVIKNELNDGSTTIARMGSSFWSKSIAFLMGFSYLGEVASIVADDIYIGKGVNFSLSRILISTHDEKEARLKLNGNIFISHDLGSMMGMEERLETISSRGWFKFSRDQSQGSDSSDLLKIEGIQFISHKDLITDKSSMVMGDQDILFRGKNLIIDGKITTTGNKQGNIILQSQQAKLNAILSSSKSIIVTVSEKLESSAKMMAVEFIALTSKNISIATPSIITAGTNINMSAVGGAVTLDGKSRANGFIDILCDKRLEVSGEHTAGTEMNLTSREEKIVINENSTLKYDTATFSGALEIENKGTRIGRTETIDALEVFEKGKIKVENTTYKKGNIHFSAKLSESKL
ncbi:MAG: hypothetical protein HQK51_06445, partial [Oligoflexia bacterium]|nr:hypothetical protein [Oligoflexia bacterium]